MAARTWLALACCLGLALSGLPVGSAGADATETLTVVVTTDTGTRIAGATVTATWADGSTTVETANNGKAFVDVPDGARVEFTVDHTEYVRNFPLVVEDASDVRGDVEIDVAEKASVTVRAMDSNGPVADVDVSLRRNGRVVAAGTTGANGTFDSGVVEAGAYRVISVKRGYYENATTVRADATSQHRVQLRAGAVTYEFNVTDPHFSPPRPVAGATINVTGIGSFNTVSGGGATARLPVNAEMDVRVTKPGYQTATRTVAVGEADGTVHVDLSRTPNLTVDPVNRRVVVGERAVVAVTDEYGDPVPNATVLRNDEPAGTTDADGEYAVLLTEPGTYEVSARYDGVTAAPVSIEAIADSTTQNTTQTTATTERPPTTTTTESNGSIPGFDAVAALAAVAVAAALLAVRQ